MSIKGIETQIMINRLPDYAKDASALYKRTEVFQDHIAKQAKANDAKEQTKVVKTNESGLEALHPEDDDSGGNAAGGFEEETEQGYNKDSDIDNLMVPGEEHVIDIKV